jgi:hypothetical protein
MVHQRVYQIAAGYEDCNDADFLRIDPDKCIPEKSRKVQFELLNRP